MTRRRMLKRPRRDDLIRAEPQGLGASYLEGVAICLVHRVRGGGGARESGARKEKNGAGHVKACMLQIAGRATTVEKARQGVVFLYPKISERIMPNMEFI